MVRHIIYVGQGCDSTKDRAVIDGAMQMNVIGCANYAEAEEAAKEMVAKGCPDIFL